MTRDGEPSPRRDTVEELTVPVYFYNPQEWSVRDTVPGAPTTFTVQLSVSTRRANAHVFNVQPPLSDYRKPRLLQGVIAAQVRVLLLLDRDARVTFSKEEDLET